MTTSVVAGLLGTLGFAPAMAAEGTLYGSVRSGIYAVNPDGSGGTTWDLGSVDAGDLGSGDKLWSRIGVKASAELDGGVTAGLHIEKRLDNFRTRHQNVYVSGPFGKITLGQQGSPYYSGVSWDGANFFGGSSDPGSRQNGVRFDTNLGGPFNFSAMVVDDNAAGGGQGNGVDGWEVGASLAAGPVNIGAGFKDQTNDDERMGITMGGSFGDMGWEIGYETTDHAATSDDESRFGFFVDYGLGDGAVYVSYEDLNAADDGMGIDNDWTIVGYSHSLGGGAKVVAEHRTPDSGADVSAVVLVVGF
jgi:hypothetical protein